MNTNTPANTCFQLLNKVLMDAFQTESLLFTPPYGDLSRIDHGIRSMMWSDFLNANERASSTIPDGNRRLFIVRSNLGFYNIIAYLNLNKQPDFISIGPFRAKEFSSDSFSQLVTSLPLSADTLLLLKYFYEGLPYAPLSPLVSTARHILAAYYPEFETIEPVSIEFSDQKREIQINMDLLQDYSADLAEIYQTSLLRFLGALKKGESDAAQKELKHFLQVTNLVSAQNITECKKGLNILNDYCHAALLETAVHPQHILKLCSALRLKIGSVNHLDALLSLPNDICHKYCLLVKNYAYPEYSKTVRSVINYINLHLEENLTLSHLAEQLRKNPTSLSYAFSREVGMSITSFIHQVRINEAIRYFNTTALSVSEVAIIVGFQDFAYFSRLFRKQVGCSPREYCRRIR